jgi:Tol biopolymer transport system component
MGEQMRRMRKSVARQGRWRQLLAATVLSGCGGDSIEPPTTGNLLVTITTEGASPDPDGFLLSTDAGEPRHVEVSASLRSENLLLGAHTVELSDIAGNCAVAGENPRTVMIIAGEEVRVPFNIACITPPPLTGTLTINTATNGSDPDLDGYAVTVDGGSMQSIPSTGTLIVSALTAGRHTVELSMLAANCHVNGGNPQDVNVAAGGLVQLSFTVLCASTEIHSKILFHRIADGVADIYVMDNDGSNQTNLTPGSKPQAFNGSWSPDGRTIAFEGSSSSSVTDIYVMSAGGGGITNLTKTPDIQETRPEWSPDGRKIAYHSDSNEGDVEIYVMNADGSGQTNLTRNPGTDVFPSWSPDGSHIAFARNEGILIMKADGSDQTKLQPEFSRSNHVSWSPDGKQIAFVRTRAELDTWTDNLWVMNPDGSGSRNLTNYPIVDGPDLFIHGYSWAPDGSQLAFSKDYDGPEAVYAVRIAGGTEARLSSGGEPRWSADGKRILFSIAEGPDSKVLVMNADGSGVVSLTHGGDGGARWQ